MRVREIHIQAAARECVGAENAIGIRKDSRLDHRQFALGQHDLAGGDALHGHRRHHFGSGDSRSSLARAGSGTSFRRVTTRGEITLLDAPVSTTNANGPTPLTNTGAITRPMRSGRVDAT